MSSQKAQASKKAAPTRKKGQKKQKIAKSTSIQFQLTWSGLISWSVFFVVLVAWAFILGVLVGRGYHPEAFLPMVAEVMPGHAQEKTEDGNPQEQVLSAQELGFFESLQAKADRPEKAAPKQAGQRQTTQPEVEIQKERQTYIYKYQVGAFQRQDQAESLRRTLNKNGFRAELAESKVQGTAWYRVLVRFKGHANEVDAFASRLRQAGMETFFLRSKNPE